MNESQTPPVAPSPEVKPAEKDKKSKKVKKEKKAKEPKPSKPRSYSGVTFMAALVFAASMFGLGFSFGLDSSPEPVTSTTTSLTAADPICSVDIFRREPGESVTFNLSSTNPDVNLSDLGLYANETELEKAGGRYILVFDGTEEYKIEARPAGGADKSASCSYGSIYVETATPVEPAVES